jgi:hypothetical protein
VRLTTSPPLRAECHGIWEPKPPGTLWVTPGLLRETSTFTEYYITLTFVKKQDFIVKHEVHFLCGRHCVILTVLCASFVKECPCYCLAYTLKKSPSPLLPFEHTVCEDSFATILHFCCHSYNKSFTFEYPIYFMSVMFSPLM